MSHTDDANEKKINERRRFLTAGAAAAGALVLGTKANAATAISTVSSEVLAPAALSPAALSLTLKDNAALAKIGGSVVVENGSDKIVVIRTDANSFAACSAICTHKGCVVEYEHDSKQLVCPCHDARFALDGKVVRGPAKKPLRSYATDAAAVVSLSGLPATSAKKPS